jgi:hypothetical protein
MSANVEMKSLSNWRITCICTAVQLLRFNRHCSHPAIPSHPALLTSPVTIHNVWKKSIAEFKMNTGVVTNGTARCAKKQAEGSVW